MLVGINLAATGRLTNNGYFGYNMLIVRNWSQTCIEPTTNP